MKLFKKTRRAIIGCSSLVIFLGLINACTRHSFSGCLDEATQNMLEDKVEQFASNAGIELPDENAEPTAAVVPAGAGTGLVVLDTTTINLSVPEYSDEAYVCLNDNAPYFSAAEIEAAKSIEPCIVLSEKDNLNRTGSAVMIASPSLLPNTERGSISDVYPSGWEQAEYSDVVPNGYVYNRCHLLAFSLTGIGSDSTPYDELSRDLITGTRYLNIEGMWAIEETVLNYVKENDTAKALYRVTPVYEGNNLVASGVIVECISLDSSEVSFCVYCYNVQPGINIDYATGETSVKLN